MNPINKINKVDAYACCVIENGNIAISHRRTLRRWLESSNYCNSEFECEIASFCGLMVNRKIVNNIGLPIKEYFIWFDDAEYSLRILKYSKIIVVSDAKLVHKTKPVVSSKATMALTWKNYYGARNTIDAYKRHRMYWKLIKSIVSYFISIIKNLIFLFEGADCKYGTKLLWNGIIDGLRGKLGKNSKYLP